MVAGTKSRSSSTDISAKNNKKNPFPYLRGISSNTLLAIKIWYIVPYQSNLPFSNLESVKFKINLGIDCWLYVDRRRNQSKIARSNGEFLNFPNDIINFFFTVDLMHCILNEMFNLFYIYIYAA